MHLSCNVSVYLPLANCVIISEMLGVKLFIVVCFATCISLVSASSIEDDIRWLQKRLDSQFWTKNIKYRRPGKWEQQKGLYTSEIHVNQVDKKNSKFASWIRNDWAIDDINMFVTNFVLYGLLQAKQLGTIQVDQHRFSLSLQAIGQFRDKNTEYGIPQYVFWPQSKVNGTWSAVPVNMLKLINSMPNVPPFLVPIVEYLFGGLAVNPKSFVSAFVIPADNDDSSINMVLHGFLKQTKSSHYPFWDSINFNKQEYYRRALKYAYRPFDSNFSENLEADEIDPRTYFNLWKYIADKKQQALKNNEKPSLILPTTWLLNKKEQIAGIVKMPFQTNNVDVTVCANFLFGLSYQVLNKEVVFTPQLEQMALDTAELLVYAVEHLVEKRPDIVLVYYPSKYDFYWFIARIVGLYKRRSQELTGSLQHISRLLSGAMRTFGTKHILETSLQNRRGDFYWVEFLGNFGKKNRDQDAVFSTALALNTLLDTWTTREGSKVNYDYNMPGQVHEKIKGGIQYLQAVLGPKMSSKNAFFSGSMREDTTLPFLYPGNVNTDGKGHNVNPQQATMRDIKMNWEHYMKGAVDAAEYQKWISWKWYGFQVPLTPSGQNTGSGMLFPYWSAEPITTIMCITSLSKFMRAEQSAIAHD